MKNFEYLQPSEVKQAAKALADGNGVRAMAGGTDLLDLMKTGIDRPDQAMAEPDLRTIKERDGVLRVGALVTLREIAESAVLRERYTVLQEAAAAAASPQLRNVGTLGGNLCQRPRCSYFRDDDFDCLRKGGDTCFAAEGRNRFHCVIGGGPCYIVHPSDTAVALLALDAKVMIQGKKRRREVPIREFFVLPEDDHERETVLEAGEVVTGVEIPEPQPGDRSSYTKFRFRESWDFAVVSVGVVVPGGGSVTDGRVALGGVAPVPWLVPGTEAGPDRELLADAEPLTENGYKLPLVRNLARRALAELLD